MNINGKSSKESESIINIGLLVEAIDEDGNWSKAEIINIIDNTLLLKFLDRIETYSRIIDIASDKWRHHIENTSKVDRFSTFRSTDFEKGDFVLAKWHDNNYYPAEILDITTKTKFGTKVKEYHILYVYDNIHEIVLLSRLKSLNKNGNNIDQSTLNMDFYDKMNNRSSRKPHRRHLESHDNDNVFYDATTKKFTENCKLRRIKLRVDNGDCSDSVMPAKISSESKKDVFLQKSIINQSSAAANQFQLQTNSSQVIQRYSQRKRRSPYKKADYFYPDSCDNNNIVVNNNNNRINNKSSNNVSQVSTPIYNNNNNNNGDDICGFSLDVKECRPLSSNHSPISVSLTSNEDLSQLKIKQESFIKVLVDEKEDQDNNNTIETLYSCTDDGKYQCLICTNKSFRKKQLVFDHIKHYHPSKTNEQPAQQIIHTTMSSSKNLYSPNKRYYSGYLKTNHRKSMERKKKFNNSQIKSLISRTSWNKYCNRNYKSCDYRVPFANNGQCNSMPDCIAGGVRTEFTINKGICDGSIVYCHRCKKSSDYSGDGDGGGRRGGHMVQCDVCLCWSHSACYGLTDNSNSINNSSSKDNDNFWECDNCTNCNNLSESTSGNKSSDWYRDQCRFYSIPRNELPWMTKNQLAVSPCSIRNICELQSCLSLCQRVLEAITRHMDKLPFRNNNNSSNNGNYSNSQEDFDLHHFYNFDELNLPRIENLDAIALNVDQEGLLNISHHCSSLNTILPSTTNIITSADILHSSSNVISSNYNFNDATFVNSTPNKTTNNKSLNTSFEGLFDCEIQQLDIPKEAFDALVEDYNLNEDICKTTNLDPLSKPSILDLIDVSCTKDIVLDSAPLAPSSSIYRNNDSDGTDSIIDLPNEYLDSLQSSHKSNIAADGVYVQDNQQSQCSQSRYVSDAVVSEYEVKLDHLHPSGSYNTDEVTFINNSSSNNDTANHRNIEIVIDNNSKEDLEEVPGCWASSLVPDVQQNHHHNNNNNNNSRGVSTHDNDPHLSDSDSCSLQWLTEKYKSVEKIVESVEQTIVSATSDHFSGTPEQQDEEACSHISRYLHSLLYILRRD